MTAGTHTSKDCVACCQKQRNKKVISEHAQKQVILQCSQVVARDTCLDAVDASWRLLHFWHSKVRCIMHSLFPESNDQQALQISTRTLLSGCLFKAPYSCFCSESPFTTPTRLGSWYPPRHHHGSGQRFCLDGLFHFRFASLRCASSLQVGTGLTRSNEHGSGANTKQSPRRRSHLFRSPTPRASDRPPPRS